MKKVLLITNSLDETGAPIALTEVARVLTNYDTVIYVLSPQDGKLRDTFLKMGIEVIVDKKVAWGSGESLNCLSNKKKWFLDEFTCMFDVIWINTLNLYQLVYRYQCSGRHIIWWIHEGGEILKFFTPYIYKQSVINTTVLTSSSFFKEELEKIQISKETQVLIPGIKEECNKINNIPEHGRVVFLTIATYDRNKGYDVLIRAIKLLPKHIKKKSMFLFVGKIIDNKYYQQLRRMALGENIIFEDAFTHNKITNKINNSDCIVVPSRYETLSISGIEAMMMKKPLIISDNTGLSSFLRSYDRELVFKNEDSNDLALKIEKMILNKDRKEYGEKLYLIYKEKLSYKIFENRVNDIVLLN